MAKRRFSRSKPLYTGYRDHTQAWRIDQLSDAMDELVSRGQPIVVFVHGRGKEPSKSLDGATWVKGLAVAKIELGYKVGVLMFNWDSAFAGLRFQDRTRALSNVPEAAESLRKLLEGMESYFKANATVRRPVLLVHSMGSIVLQRLLNFGGWPSDSRIFKQVLISQPDADDVDHATWLESLARHEKVFVTFNADDKVLRRSNDDRPYGSHALGLGTTSPLAESATYVDLTDMGPVGSDDGKDDDHEVFGKGAMNGQVYVCQFFEQALTGADVVLDLKSNVESVDREVVHRLRSKNSPTAPCLTIPAIPE